MSVIVCSMKWSKTVLEDRPGAWKRGRVEGEVGMEGGEKVSRKGKF